MRPLPRWSLPLALTAAVVTAGALLGVGVAAEPAPSGATISEPPARISPPAPARHALSWQSANAAGDCGAVIATLPAPSEATERLAAARCLERSGQAGRALEVLVATDGPFAPYVALVRAQALLDRDRAADAVTALAGVSLPGVDDALLRGRALVQAGRSLEARDGLRTLLEGPAADEARWWLAVGAEERGDLPAAIGTYQALWSRHPTSAWATRAAERLVKLGSPVPDLDTPEGRTLAMSRAKRLLELQQAGMAVPLLDAIHARDPFDTPAEQRFMAEALFDARLHGRAVEWFGKGGAATSSASDAFHEALSTARSGDYAGAAERYRAMAERFPDAPQADEAAWKIPYMDYDAGKLEAAESGLAAYVAAHPNGKFVADARWFRAWAAYRRGDTRTAIARFDEVVAKHPTSELATAARYWKARATDDAVALREVLRSAPDTGYAFFAAERLGVKYPAPAEAPLPTLPEAFVATRPSLALGVRLAEAGFAEWARPLLTPHVADAKSAGEATARGHARWLVAAEDYRGATAPAAPGCGTPAARSVCVPRPHLEAVTAVAARTGLPRMLPYAIMNAESGLDPSVTSPAGARGLMQLMPELAVRLAADDLPGFAVDDLYRAGVNARLGTAELGLLHARFDGRGVTPSLPLVIAGYNGGADAVGRWVDGYATAPDADRFAEDVSFTETRRYVRRVLGFLMQYRRTYGDPS